MVRCGKCCRSRLQEGREVAAARGEAEAEAARAVVGERRAELVVAAAALVRMQAPLVVAQIHAPLGEP